MGTKEILEFVKIEHTLFSLPFVLIGYILAYNQFIYELSSNDFAWIRMDLLWILIAAVGVANLVKKDWVKDGSIIIDVGINKQGDKIVGDVSFEEVKDKAKAITPVPGGVGPMTIACLLKNTLECFKKLN